MSIIWNGFSEILHTVRKGWKGRGEPPAAQDEIGYPLNIETPKSPYRRIPDQSKSFESMAKRCAMGDLESMFQMSREFRSRLTQEEQILEKAYFTQNTNESLERLNSYLESHAEEHFFFQAANMWLNRAALYGSEKAETLLEKFPLYRGTGYISILFQLPGNHQRKSVEGAVMKKLGFLDFDDKISYDLESLDNSVVYTGSCYVSYDGVDERGFGMEEEDDYYYFDEFFRLLYILRRWSVRDIRSDRDRITSECKHKIAEQQREREKFWNSYRNKPGMKRYQFLVREIHGPDIRNDILFNYQQDLELLGVGHENAVIPEGVKRISYAAFKDCENIESVELTDSITEIGEYAFSGCKSLKSFRWPSAVPVVSQRVFFHCYQLEEVILPDTVKEIQEGAFLGCKGLKKITIPDSVETIGGGAFMYCESLEQVFMPKKLKKIGDNAFYFCKKLGEIYVPESVLAGKDIFYGCKTVSGKNMYVCRNKNYG